MIEENELIGAKPLSEGQIVKGATIINVVQKFGVPRTTVTDIKKQKDQFREFAGEMEESNVPNPILD